MNQSIVSDLVGVISCTWRARAAASGACRPNRWRTLAMCVYSAYVGSRFVVWSESPYPKCRGWPSVAIQFHRM
ncbi:MAG: hypothetical protein BWY79_02148 [Actinobacteria bacterium ADurb.Bin444]|nr:MAG: hypothetical protein BWY79_02148 [Actinobacteria bacterium ADurb.Bin444]